MRNSKYVVTIAYQLGSRGPQIAERMGELLNIRCYDRDLIVKTAQKTDISEEIIEEEEESAAALPPRVFPFITRPLEKKTSETQDEIFMAQQEIIKSLVSKEDCIIVGRCADYTLSEKKHSIHVYIYSPFDVRVKNSMEDYSMNSADTKKMLVEDDEEVKSYYISYAGYKPDDKNHKDILIDSSLFGTEGTAEYLAEAVRRKFGVE